MKTLNVATQGGRLWTCSYVQEEQMAAYLSNSLLAEKQGCASLTSDTLACKVKPTPQEVRRVQASNREVSCIVGPHRHRARVSALKGPVKSEF